MTLFGTHVGSIPSSRAALIAGYHSEYDRFAGDYPIERFEEAVALTAGVPYTLSVHRVYHEIEDSFLKDNDDAHVTRDGIAGRSLAMSSKVRGIGTWAQAGSATSGTLYNAIVTRGNEVAAWLAANPTCDIWWTLHHEPNNGDSTTAALSGSTVEATGINNWHAALQNIYTIWTTTCGVPVYVGAQDGTVVSHGLLLAGPNLAGPSGTTGAATWQLYYGTPDGSAGVARPWFWDHVQMAPVDTYPGTSSGNALWRAFPEDFLGDGGSGSTTNGMADFIPARITAQNNAGKILYPSIWELGFAEIDDLNVAGTANVFNAATASPNWPSGLPKTRPNQFIRAADYFTNTGATHWGGYPFHSVLYWDSLVDPNGRAPWMPDTTTASWDAYVDFIFAIEGEVTAPPPTASAGVGFVLG